MTRLMLMLAGASLSAWLHAKPPEFGVIFPGGGQVGTSFEISTTITNKPVSEWWTSAPGVTFTATDKPEKWKVTIPAETPIGLYPIARRNAEGVSSTRWFSVGRFPEIVEAEPNNGYSTSQSIASLPVCVNARLGEGNDVDHFKVALKSGQTLVGMVEAYSIGSNVDVMAHVVGPDGTRIHTTSDHRNLDPLIVFTAPADGEYTVQIAGFAHPPQANVNYAGGAAVVYRLHLTTGPVVTHFHPFAVSTDHPTKVTLQGHNLDPSKREITIEPNAPRVSGGMSLVDLPDALVPLQALRIQGIPTQEQEADDSLAHGTVIQQGFVGGVISEANEKDRFAIEMKKGMKLQSKVYAAVLGLPLDATLQVLGPDGKQLGENDDYNGTPDPRVIWTAPADGLYQIVVQDTLQQGGSGCHYVLEVSPPRASVEITLAATQTLSLQTGGNTSVKFAVKRLDGWNKPLVARVSGLPTGVSCPEVRLGEKDTEVEIKFSATQEVSLGNHLLTFGFEPAPVEGQPSQGTGEKIPVSISLRGESARGSSLLDVTDSLWLSVLPSAGVPKDASVPQP